ncbi:hypothetical protein ACFSS9_04065 [Paenibacillus septentrionalis]|uniref:hypothetical protein n=1 Tax=Paenibacillus septentrionalis TaxID=429342 RepID=UPI00363E7E12
MKGKKAEQNEDTRPAADAFQRAGGSAGDGKSNRRSARVFHRCKSNVSVAMQLLVEGGIKAAPPYSLAQAFVPRFVEG